MPKTSSRAITVSAGTADVIESIAKVEFSIPEIYDIVRKANACMIWGGSLGLASADDKIIQIERLINIDPESQLLASILAKKLSVGSKYILIDVPFGKSAKLATKSQASMLKEKFEILARDFHVKLQCALTDGSQPVGNGVGPILEIRDVLSVLKQDPNRPLDLEKKSLLLSGLLLEMTGKAGRGHGKKLAENILKSGKALAKFEEIIKAQSGSLSSRKLKLGPFSEDIRAKKHGKIIETDNKKISFLARLLGCPADKASGIFIHRHNGATVNRKEPLLTFYAESDDKLKEAVKFCKRIRPIKIKS
jgi:putative thymidine phosphorylase